MSEAGIVARLFFAAAAQFCECSVVGGGLRLRNAICRAAIE